MFEKIKKVFGSQRDAGMEIEKKEGYLINEAGQHIPLDQVRPADLRRHEIVMELAEELIDLRGDIVQARARAGQAIDSFLAEAYADYGVAYAGAKGGVTLSSFDGRYKIQRQISDRLNFDERIGAAKALIDECITEWSAGASDEIKTLVDAAFDVDKQGKLNIRRIVGLRRLGIDHAKWRQAMEAISDSLHVVQSKAYIRLYERQPDGSYRMLPLDMSAV